MNPDRRPVMQNQLKPQWYPKSSTKTCPECNVEFLDDGRDICMSCKAGLPII